jgi:hypothetical protein
MQLVTAIAPLGILLLRHLGVASYPLYLQQIIEVLTVGKIRSYIHKCNG